MDIVQSTLDSILFSEKTTHRSDLVVQGPARNIHEAFWADAFHRNLRLEDVEIEFRLGKLSPFGKGPFNTTIPKLLFDSMIISLQDYDSWDEISHTRDVVGYFPEEDQSIRLIVHEDGSKTTQSKQKLTQADFFGVTLPFDFRMAINIELKLDSDRKLEQATRVVTRERHSFALKNVQYDLTRITHFDGTQEHQIELEILNLTELQLTSVNSQSLTIELQQRLVDIMNACEPVRDFNVKLCRKRNF
tara:strand:- start:628 stop:1365 length:738 start_codon:yes stop_codon:yes gene_type:complete